jgi:hypothetical protein
MARSRKSRFKDLSILTGGLYVFVVAMLILQSRLRRLRP